MDSHNKSFKTREQIIAENPIADFLRAQGVKLRPAGANFATSSCPKTRHNKPDHRPVSIDVEKNAWYCNDCGIGGYVIEWLMYLRDVPVGRAMAIFSGKNGSPSSRLVATYDYTDESGKLLFQSCRYEPKNFKQRRPDGAGGWIWNLDGVRRVLYHLPEVVTASTVAVCEGEKDCDNLRKLGIIATCNPGGAGKWRDEYSESLRGKDILLFPDLDEAGAAHVEQVAKSLRGIANSIHRITLPVGCKDVSEFLALLTDDDARAAVDRLISEATPVSFPAIRVARNDSQQNGEEEPYVVVDDFPEPISDAAYYGLAGDIVRLIEPHTEASPVALLIQILSAFGNVIGRGAWAVADGTRHFMNLFSVLVGPTSKARKGTSWQHILRLFEEVDRYWAKERIADGLSTGEGLIYKVRDPVAKNVSDKKTKQSELVIVDEGVQDKRLFLCEGEFANVLKVMSRPGNTLSGVVRNAWDKGELRSLTKGSDNFATNASVSIHAHITADELRKSLTETESGNGFANRFIFLAAKRSKVLPEGGNITIKDMSALIERLKKAVEFACKAGEITRDDSARELWRECYPSLSEGKPGLLGAVTARAEAQVLRLSTVDALLNCSNQITADYHRAGMAIWDYSERSARWIFATATGNPIADRIRLALQAVGDAGMSQSEISIRVLNRNIPADQIRDAFRVLYESHQATFVKESTGGAPLTRWFAT